MDTALQPSAIDHIEIPGEGTFGKTTGIPPVRINFPLESEMRRGPFILLFQAFLVALSCLMLDLGFSVADSIQGLLTFFLNAAIILIGIVGLTASAPYFYDLMTRGPHLVMDAQGIHDRRMLRTPLRWIDIAEATCTSGKLIHYNALSIRAKHPIPAYRNPFRFPGFLHLFVRREDRLIIPLDGFRNNRFLGETALAMVRRHGGTVY